MIKDYFRIAFQALSRRGIRSWLTMIGIFIGIAAVVSLISLGSGLKLAVAQQFNILGAERIQIQAKGVGTGPPGTNVVNPLTDKDLKIIQRTNGIAVAAGRILRRASVELDRKKYTAFIGSSPKDAAQKAWIDQIGNVEIAQGRELKPRDKYKIVIGDRFHSDKKFGKNLNVGDKITLQGHEFEIVGVNKKQGAFTVDGLIIMNEEVMREIYNIPDEYSIIGAKASNLKDIDLDVERIKKELRKERNVKEGKEDFTVQTSVQSMQAISDVLDIVTILLSGIAAISLVVGGIGIMNTMYTSVLERQTDIGIMKAIGAKNSDIFKIFFLESGMLGLTGGLIGIILGFGIGKLVEFIAQTALGSNLLQASFSPQLLIGAALFSFVVGATAGTLPALGAARQNPVDALRD